MSKENNTFVGINEGVVRGYFQFGVMIEDVFHSMYFGSMTELADEWMLKSLMDMARTGDHMADWYLIFNPQDLGDVEQTDWYKGNE